jgi:hypothetical protein
LLTLLIDIREERDVFESASSTLPIISMSYDVADDEDENDGLFSKQDMMLMSMKYILYHPSYSM